MRKPRATTAKSLMPQCLTEDRQIEARLAWVNPYLGVCWPKLMLLLLLSLTFAAGHLQAQCTFSCPSALNISLAGPAQNCQSIVSPTLLGVRTTNCTGLIDVDLLDSRGLTLPGTVEADGSRRGLLTSLLIGRALRARITDRTSGNSCLITIGVQDNLAPLISSRDTVLLPFRDAAARTQGGPLPDATVRDCSGFTLSYQDSVATSVCSPAGPEQRIRTVIYRRWLAVDAGGYSAKSTQRLEVLRLQLTGLEAPRDTVLPCADRPNTALNYGHLHWRDLASGGRVVLPTLDGSYDDIYWSHSDETFAGAGGTSQVLRTWRVYDACADVGPSNPRNFVQRIAVRDLVPPIVTVAPDTLFLQATTSACTADEAMPVAAVTDACDSAPTVTTRIYNRTLPQNGGRITHLPLGHHTLIYTARDASGNQTVVQRPVLVRDVAAPVLSVHPVRMIALPSSTSVAITADGYDAGSYETCGGYTLGIRRWGTATYAPQVQVDCRDVGLDLRLEIEAVDESGNCARTEVVAQVRDFLAPSVVAPASRHVSCDAFDPLLIIYGVATVNDNCSFTVRDSVVDLRNSCGVGDIVRYWLATDQVGLRASASQRLTVTAGAGFGESRIVWPRDTLLQCAAAADTANLPLRYRRPQLQATPCARTSFSYSDRTLSLPGQCPYVERTWRILDACRPAGSANSSFEHTQRLRFNDVVAPQVIGMPDSLTLIASDTTCAGVQLPTTAWTAIDCGVPLPLKLTFRRLGTSAWWPLLASTRLTPQAYEVSAEATDRCGNVARRITLVTIKDGLRPLALCRQEVELPYPGEALAVDATQINLSSHDRCGGSVTLSTTALSPSCAQVVQPQLAALLVQDLAGNTATCTSRITWRDEAKRCPPARVEFHTRIATSRGFGLPSTIEIRRASGGTLLQSYTTNGNGELSATWPTTEQVTVAARTSHDMLAGVTSFDLFLIGRHILGLRPLAAGPQQWSADANHSGSVSAYDITVLRRVMLELDAALPGGHSYRLVALDAAGRPLANGSNPQLLAPSYEVHSPRWLAVKIGDVSGTPAQFTDDGGPLLHSRSGVASAEPVLLRQSKMTRDVVALVAAEDQVWWAAKLQLPGMLLRLSPKLAPHTLLNQGPQQVKLSVLSAEQGVHLVAGDTLALVQLQPSSIRTSNAVGSVTVGELADEAQERPLEIVDTPEAASTEALPTQARDQMLLYPNPVRLGQRLKLVEPKLSETLASLWLVDATGRVRQLSTVLSAEDSGAVDTELGQDLAPGIYTLQLVFRDGRRTLQRLIVRP